MSKRYKNIIGLVLALLAVISALGVFVNYAQSKERLSLLINQEIVIYENGSELTRVTMDYMSDGLEARKFIANLKSSTMISPEEHEYEGFALSDIFAFAELSLVGKSRVIVESVDGYRVPLKIEEIMELDNIFLVYKDDGKYLGSYKDKGGQGPFMIVVKGDRFSQRWAKYVTGLDVE